MADNSSLPVASGNETFANNDIGGVKYPRVKVTWGPAGTSNDADVASGKPLPVQLRASDGTAVTVKAASTPAAAADTAVVVALSPNGQNANGSASDANSAPTTHSTEDKAAVGSLTETAPATDTASSGLNGRLQRIAQRISASLVVDDAAFTPATTSVCMAGFEADESSTDSVDEGDSGAARMTLDRKLISTMQPHTKGGLLAFNSLDLDETEEDVKTSAGQVYYINATNRTTSVRYLRFYNATAANTTVGSTATFLGPFTIPANATDFTVLNLGFGSLGVEFDTAICASVTTGFAANDVGAPGTNDCIVNVLYK